MWIFNIFTFEIIFFDETICKCTAKLSLDMNEKRNLLAETNFVFNLNEISCQIHFPTQFGF